MILGIAALLFIAMLVAAILYPGSALAALVCVFGLEQWLQANNAFFAQNATFVNYASAVIVVFAFCSSWLQGGHPFRRITATEWSILAFYLLFLISGFWTISRVWWMSTTHAAAPYVFAYLLLLPRIYRRQSDFRHAAIGVIVFGGIAMVLLLFGTELHEWGRSVKWDTEVVDRYGRFREKGNPLAIATLGAHVAIFAMFIAWRKGKGNAFGLVRFLLVAGGCALSFRSESRGQVVALIVVLLCFLPFRWPRLSIGAFFGIAATIAIVVAIVAWSVSFSSIEGRFDPKNFAEAYTSTRVDTCSRSLSEWIRQSPVQILFGMGGGSTWHILDGTYPHVTAVQVLCELGVFGLMILTWIFIRTGLAIWTLAGLSKQNVASRSTVCAFAAVCAFEFVMSFKQGAIFDSYTLFAWLILIARYEVALKSEAQKSVSRAKMARSLRSGSPSPESPWRPLGA